MPQSDELGTGPGSGQPVGKGTGTQGRGDGQGSEGTSDGGHAGSRHCSPQPATVLIRATVEHIGLIGDTELTVNVKWPASIFCVQPCGKPAAPAAQGSDTQHVPGNGPEASNFVTVFGEAVPDLQPESIIVRRSELAAIAQENDPHKVKLAIAKLESKGKPTASEAETGCTPDTKPDPEKSTK